MNAAARPFGARTGRPGVVRRGATRPADEGFTLVELLVAMTLFLVLSAMVLTAVLALSKGLDKARETSNLSGEARVALERIAREVRQADELANTGATSMTVKVDFDGDGVIKGSLADPEVVTYAYASGTKSIAMAAQDEFGGTVTESLLAGQVAGLDFAYRSSNWAAYGPNTDVTNPLDIDRVQITLTVVDKEGRSEVFRTQATLRNRSQS